MADQYYYDVVMLLPLNGSNGSTAFPDSAIRNYQMIAPNGGVTISTAQSKFGGASALFSGASAYMTPTLFNLDLGLGAFTIEFWVRFTSLTGVQGLINLRLGNGSAPVLRKNAANQLEFSASGTSTPAAGAATFALNTWHFVSFQRRTTPSNQIRAFLDGVQVTVNTADTTTLNGITGIYIGRDDGANYLSGYVDDLRITRQIDRYDAFGGATNYTPPASAFDTSTMPLNKEFIDTSIAPVKIGGIPAMAYKLASPAIMLYDAVWGGAGRVSGTTKVKGTPNYAVRRKVRLHRDVDGMLVREQWSNATSGAYSFDSIDATKKYTVITYDYEHNFRAVIADNITPDPMP